jgi:hypothetical protein
MSRRSLATFVLPLLLVGLGACGSSSHSSSSSASSTASTPTTTASTGTTSKAKPPSHSRSTGSPNGGGSKPSGPPPPPDGLRATSGYGTYELCSGACSGSVPSSLRRPLRAPSSCTPQAASGPAKPTPADPLSITPFIGSSWKAGRVTWSSGGYNGPVLIRGRQVGGSGAVGFGEGHVPYDELQLQGSGPWQSFTRLRSSGCFYYQVDGTSFSETIVFHAM